MKHVDNVVAIRSAAQAAHGARVEQRQRVNGQPNGYVATSEDDLWAQRHATAKDYKPTHGGYPTH
jgi:hypothetical protein